MVVLPQLREKLYLADEPPLVWQSTAAIRPVQSHTGRNQMVWHHSTLDFSFVLDLVGQEAGRDHYFADHRTTGHAAYCKHSYADQAGEGRMDSTSVRTTVQLMNRIRSIYKQSGRSRHKNG